MITIAALFTKDSGDPATGLTLAEIDLYLYRRTKADGSVSTLWTAQHPTEEVGGGLYSKAYTGEDWTLYQYFGHAQYTGATSLDSNYSLQVSTDAQPGDEMAVVSASLTSIADSVLDEVIEGTYTLRQMMRVVFSALAGLSSGGGTTTIMFQDVADSKARITATVTAAGNRTAITLDAT